MRARTKWRKPTTFLGVAQFAAAVPSLAEAWENTVTRDIAVGRTVGEYVIRRRIGVGAMGIVYEAEHPQIGRRVAIKLLRPGPLTDSRGLLEEARVVATLHHRHIIDIFGYGDLPGLGQYLVMELLEGNSLDAEVKLRAPLPPLEVVSILEEALAGLSAAHSKGVVHRDLKPANLFLVRESGGGRYVKVLDFGLARPATTANDGKVKPTKAGVVVGTPAYIAPEAALGQDVDGRSDLYALGVVAFELLTGALPFWSTNMVHLALAHVQKQPPSLTSYEPELLPELDALVLKMLAKDPAKRPTTAEAQEELAQIRKKLLAPAPVAQPPQLPQPVRPAERSTRPWLMLIPIAAALALTAYVLVPRDQAKPPEVPQPPPVALVPSDPDPDPDPDPAADNEPETEPDTEPEPATEPTTERTRPPRHRRKPPKTTPTPGTLQIIANGCSMKVLVDGKEVGHTPVRPLALSQGEHKVKLINPLCKPASWEKSVVVSSGGAVKLQQAFEPLQ